MDDAIELIEKGCGFLSINEGDMKYILVKDGDKLRWFKVERKEFVEKARNGILYYYNFCSVIFIPKTDLKKLITELRENENGNK